MRCRQFAILIGSVPVQQQIVMSAFHVVILMYTLHDLLDVCWCVRNSVVIIGVASLGPGGTPSRRMAEIFCVAVS